MAQAFRRTKKESGEEGQGKRGLDTPTSAVRCERPKRLGNYCVAFATTGVPYVRVYSDRFRHTLSFLEFPHSRHPPRCV